MSKVVVWTPGDARVWWACSICKVEAGISPPIDLDELIKRVSLFKDEHADCGQKQPASFPWRIRL